MKETVDMLEIFGEYVTQMGTSSLFVIIMQQALYLIYF